MNFEIDDIVRIKPKGNSWKFLAPFELKVSFIQQKNEIVVMVINTEKN